MELREFIKGVLTDVIMSVAEARDELSATGAKIAPPVESRENSANPVAKRIGVNNESLNASYAAMQTSNIEFEVLLAEVANNNSTSGIGVALSVIGIGSLKEKGGETASHTKIKFTIPIMFPLVLTNKK